MSPPAARRPWFELGFAWQPRQQPARWFGFERDVAWQGARELELRALAKRHRPIGTAGLVDGLHVAGLQ